MPTAISSQCDNLRLACELVGRFQYHFSKIEHALDVGIAKFLDLNEGAALIVCANMDTKKKIDTIQSIVRLQFEDKDKSIEKLLNKIAGINNPDRQTVIHSSFEANGADGVKFKRVLARGELDTKPITWTLKDFDVHFSKMEKAASDLEKLVAKITAYVPSLDFSDSRNSGFLGAL